MSYLLAVGHAVPSHVVSNESLTEFMDTSDDWIVTRSGIRERCWAREGNKVFRGVSSQELAYSATRDACNRGSVDVNDIDAIVYATISPDNEMPGSAVLLANMLNPSKAISIFEVRNQCSGFLYGMMLANSLIAAGTYKNILLVGVEIQSSGLNLSTVGRNTAVLFADGCGVAILSSQSKGALAKIHRTKLRSDGRYTDKLGIRYPAFARTCPVSVEDFSDEALGMYPEMDGKFVFKAASLAMPSIVKEILQDQGLQLADLDLVVPHQANQRIIDMLSAELGPTVKVFSNIAKYGNTTAASIPIALSESLYDGLITQGQKVCLVSFGAGFSWGAALLEFY